MKRLVLLTMVIGLFGCQHRVHIGIAGGVETNVQVAGHKLYSSLDPRDGEIVYAGVRSEFLTKAVVTLDGNDIGVFRDGARVPIKLQTFGRHVISARIYVELKETTELIGCFYDVFNVNPLYGRTSDTASDFWRVVVYANRC